MSIQFNDTSTKTGTVQEINDICNSDNNSYPIESKTRRVNAALDRFFTLAFDTAGLWPYDDTNWNTEPIQTINIVSGTQSYDLGTFTSEIINILRVELYNSAAATTANVLDRLKRDSISDSLTSYTVSGIPSQYDLIGQNIWLYPKPNYSCTNGLKIYMERNKSAFLYTDTTKVLPVPSIFVQYICRLTSLPYLIEFQKPQKNDIATQISMDEEAIKNYFANREKNVRKIMTPKKISYI